MGLGIWHRCGLRHLAFGIGVGLGISHLESGIWHRCGFTHLAFGIGVGLGIWHLASRWVLEFGI